MKGVSAQLTLQKSPELPTILNPQRDKGMHSLAQGSKCKRLEWCH